MTRKGVRGLGCRGTNRRGLLPGRRETRRPALRGPFDGCVAHIDQPLTVLGAQGRVDLDSAQPALVIEQRQLVGEFAGFRI